MTRVVHRLRGFALVGGWATWPVALAGVLTLAYVALIATGTNAFPHYFAVTQALYLPVGFIAVGLSARTAWSRRGERRAFAAWILVAVSLAAFWLGDVLWVIAEIAHGTAESPTWADIGYLAYYPLLLAALSLLSVRSGSRGERLRIGLDVATIFLGGGLLVWYLVLRPAVGGVESRLAGAITVAYPVGDLLLILGIAILAVRHSRFRSRLALISLLGAVLVGFAADLGFGFTQAQGASVSDDAIDAIYAVSWFLFGLAAALERSAGARETAAKIPENKHPAAATGGPYVLPYVAIVIALGVLVWILRLTFDTAESAAALVAVLITVVAMTRQIVAMRESSRLRERQALAASEERFQHVLRRTQFSVDHAADSMMWLDSSGRIVDVNESTCRQLEYSRDELLGMSVLDIDPIFAREPERWPHDWQATREQGSRVFESEHRTKSGRVFPVEVTANYLEYAGEALGCSFAHDITSRKRTERLLRETESQLQQAQKMDAIGQLAGGIAHDFNNMLTAIVGYCAMILPSAELSESVREDVQAIKSAADRASALTRQILLFSRRQPLKPQVVEMNYIVAQIEQLLRRTLGEHVELVTILDPDAGQVEVDVAQFEQAITNLAVNARDAMPEGGRLTIETGMVEVDHEFCARHPGIQPGSHTVLAVSDTGTGMDEVTKTRAFEPFYTTKETGKGSGLGLATVYGTVRQSRGGIFIYSEPGLGTTIKIYLPRMAEEQVMSGEGDTGSLPVAATHHPCVPVGAKTLLVVEDEESIRRLVTRVLESQQYRVIPAATAAEALAIMHLEAEDIDMLLTDVILPGSMQGGELAREVEALRPGLPILYMSGYTRETILRAGRLQDGMHYLEKPFSPDVLTRRVHDVLNQSPGNGTGGAEKAKA